MEGTGAPMDTEAPAAAAAAAVPMDTGGGGGAAADDAAGGAGAADGAGDGLLDVEAYVSKYVGQTRVKRLRFIANKAEERNHTATRLEAYKLLIAALKQGINTSAYKEACAKVGAALGPEYRLDSAWVIKVEKSNKSALDRMEQDLQVSKNNSMKDGVRWATA